jgi:hypothetical protein
VSEPKPYTDIGGGGRYPPHGEDFFDRVVNVHWPKKRRSVLPAAFSFAGYVSFTEVIPPTEFALGQSTPHFTWLGGTSADGKSWKSSQNEEGLAIFCCVRGKIGESFIAVAAGGVIVGPYNFGPGYGIAWGVVPAACVSNDDGLTWSDAGIPVQEHILKPPNPDTGEGAHSAQGSCNAVAYHPGTQTFYVGGSVNFDMGTDIYIEDRMYRGSGSGFGLVYSARRDIFAPFEGFPWPAGGSKPEDRLRVADKTLTTEPGPDVVLYHYEGTEIVCSSGCRRLWRHIGRNGR